MCQASQHCHQTCDSINCNSSTCPSNDCTQQCFVADCGRMVCEEDVSKCNQVAIIPKTGQDMHCGARSCNQECKSCKKSYLSEMTCSSSVETCEQRGLNGKFYLKYLAGVKNCTQKTDLFSSLLWNAMETNVCKVAFTARATWTAHPVCENVHSLKMGLGLLWSQWAAMHRSVHSTAAIAAVTWFVR